MRSKSKQVVYGLLVVVCCSIYDFEEIKTTPKPLVVPAGWPQPGYELSKNHVTGEGVELG